MRTKNRIHSQLTEEPAHLMMETGIVLLLFILFKDVDGSNDGIVGGTEAAPHSRPYMASLQFQGQHFCGGVLVKEDYVLTAAHCKISESVFRTARVVLGAHSLSAQEPSKQVFGVTRSITHPEYDGEENDIMLLQLDRRATLTSAVQVIPLSSPTKLSQCSTAGWGDIGDNNTIPDKLQEVRANILKRTKCRRRWGSVPITVRMVCATGPQPSQGFCSGDSGGPLVCNGTSAGVVSFSGERCANPSTPDVYMRTSSYSSWIMQVIGPAENTYIDVEA